MHRNEILDACKILFDDYSENLNFLNILSVDFIKSRYRKKAMTYHPDLYFNYPKHIIEEKKINFIKINEAYNKLLKFVSKNNVQVIFSKYKNSNLNIHKNKKLTLPNKALKFAEFLYYNNIITWNNLIKSLVWQKNNRSKIGEIALRWHYINKLELEYVLKLKQTFRKPIGQIMLKLHVINDFQLNILLYQQLKEQPKIGEYFLSNNLINERTIKKYLNLQSDHNKRFVKNKSTNLF